MHYVIIGAGPAGITAAEQLRKLDNNAAITVIGEEKEPPYSRMALPYFLTQHIDVTGTYLRKTSGHYQSLNIKLSQQLVTAIKPEQKRLVLDNGTDLSFDKLLIATGSRAVKPAIPGIGLANIHTCWTLEDGRKIAARLKPGCRVVLMGAGFIGCIILEALVKSGAELTVIEMADRMVPRMMNVKAGGLIKQWCTDKGVQILTATEITAITQDENNPLRVFLNNGESKIADLVVSATGVKPNINFLKGSGIDTDHGILVDRHFQTNRADIYAAGDVAQGLDFSTGEQSVQAIQPTAVDHGALAAKNMAGARSAVHQGSINMNVLDTMGLIACSFGLWMGTENGEMVERYDPERYHYLNLQFDKNCLVGATAIGLTEHVGVLRGLIQSRIKLGHWQQRLMQNPTRLMEAYLCCTQAIGAKANLRPR